MIMIGINFTFNFTKFCVIILTKLLTLGILFSTAVRVVVVGVGGRAAAGKLLGILFLTLFILALQAVVVAKLVILGIAF